MVRRKSSGFTIIELMIVVALVAIIAAIAVPGFQGLIESNRFKSTTNNVIGILNYARSEAVRRGEPVAVQAAGGTLQDGLSVVVLSEPADAPPNPLRELAAIPGSVSLSLDSGDMPIFRGNGMNGAGSRMDFTPSTFLICPGNGNPGVNIVVNAGGQTSRSSVEASCP